MIAIKKLLLLLVSFVFYTLSNAQVEFGRLSSNGYSAAIYGLNTSNAHALSKNNAIIEDVGFDYSSDSKKDTSHYLFLIRPQAGYLHTFSNSGQGFYIEPTLGYSFGLSDLTQKTSGPIVGIGIGNLAELAQFRYNFGIRYEHAFVLGGPSQDIFLIAVRYTLWEIKKNRSRKK